jgi:uncharacterized protein YjbI with pentapeptide repeats
MLETPTQPRKEKFMSASSLGEAEGVVRRSRTYTPYKQYASYREIAPSHPGYPNDMPYGLLPGLNLGGASLSHTDLRWKNFRGANFHRANLGGSLLWSVNLVNADLSHADLRHPDLTGADLSGADLTSAKTESACFLGARYSPNTRFPEDFGEPQRRGMVNIQESLQLSCN